jgi:hypothetical protein
MKPPDQAASVQLRSVFEAAMDFGLSDEQVWDAAKEVAARTPVDKPARECIGEVVDALARRIEERN